MTTKNDFNVSVGAALCAHRDVLAIPQRELAARAGVSPNYIARLERGELCPSLRVANQLGRALGVSVDTIIPEAA